MLAKALWATGDRPRARELARSARDALRDAGAGNEKNLADAQKWLADHVGDDD